MGMVRKVLWGATAVAWPLSGALGPKGASWWPGTVAAVLAATCCPLALITMWARRRWLARHDGKRLRTPATGAGRIRTERNARIALWAGAVAGWPLLGAAATIPALSGLALTLALGCPATLITMWWKRRRAAVTAPEVAQRVDDLAGAVAWALEEAGREVPGGLRPTGTESARPERPHLRACDTGDLPRVRR
jgi:hypothetical protein